MLNYLDSGSIVIGSQSAGLLGDSCFLLASSFTCFLEYLGTFFMRTVTVQVQVSIYSKWHILVQNNFINESVWLDRWGDVFNLWVDFIS